MSDGTSLRRTLMRGVRRTLRRSLPRWRPAAALSSVVALTVGTWACGGTEPPPYRVFVTNEY